MTRRDPQTLKKIILLIHKITNQKYKRLRHLNEVLCFFFAHTQIRDFKSFLDLLCINVYSFALHSHD
jgi:hypothetical protein